jgi:hypothetical protein
MMRHLEPLRPAGTFLWRLSATLVGDKIPLFCFLCLLLFQGVVAQPAKKSQSGNVWDEPKVAVPKSPGVPRPVKKPLLTLRWQLLTLDQQNQEQAVDPASRNFADGDWVRLGVQINQDGYLYIINHTVEKDGKITPPTLISKEQNLIKKDTVIELPTIGSSKYQRNNKYWWQMRPPAGREVITIIFSRGRVEKLAEAAGQDVNRDVLVSDSLLFELSRRAPEPSHKLWTPEMQKQAKLQGVKGAHVTMVWNPNPSNNDLLVERIEFNHQ